jgi:hypothetical protein
MTVIEEIRERRLLLGMTQADAARIANVRQWREIEAGFCDPTAAALGRMAEAVGLRLTTVPAGPTLHLNRSDEVRGLVVRMATPDAMGCRQFSGRAIAAQTGVSRVRVKQIELELHEAGELKSATMIMGRDVVARRGWGVRGTQPGARIGYRTVT